MRGLLSLAVFATAGLVAAAPALAERGPMPQAGLFDVADPTAPVRDRVLPGPTGTIARASAGAQRYPVNDGKGRTVAITVSAFCNPATCNSAEPQLIADFLGTLIHGDEISLLTVQLLTDGEIRGRCGLGAGACYFSGADTMLINGNDRTGPDGASRDFVIAHEYGHHVAEHRRNPPFQPTIFWGTKRWATYERVCQGTRQGRYFPGDEGPRYFQNPGEAFAEAFAFNRFRRAPVAWAWSAPLRPTREAFRSLRQDTLVPWQSRTRFVMTGTLPAGGRDRAVKRFRTPLDGALSVRLSGPRAARLDLLLRDRAGRPLALSRGPSSAEHVVFTVCGQSRLRAVVQRNGSGRAPFRLVVRRP